MRSRIWSLPDYPGELTALELSKVKFIFVAPTHFLLKRSGERLLKYQLYSPYVMILILDYPGDFQPS